MVSIILTMIGWGKAMIGKLIDVTNFNRQEAVEFIRMRYTDCDIYYF